MRNYWIKYLVLLIIFNSPFILLSSVYTGNPDIRTSILFTDEQSDISPDGEKEKPISNLSMLIEAKKEAMIGNTEGAITMFRHYINRYPLDPAGCFELARLEASRQNFSDALHLAQKASELDTENIWYQLFLADLYQQGGKYEKAILIFETIAGKNPENLDYYYQLATLYLMVGDYRNAIRMYDRVEEKAGISEEITLQKNKIYLRLNDMTNAENELRKLIQAFPGESRYYSILAEFFMANGKSIEALEVYKKIAQMEPDNAYIHMSMADYYRKAGKKEKAFEELKLGFANPNLDVDTKVNILLSFYSINEIYSELKDQAFILSKILMDTHPGDPKSHSIYGDLLLQEKKYPEARVSFLKVLALDSSKYIVWEQLLRLDLQLGDYQHLFDYSQRTFELFPEQPLPYLFSGLACYQLKKFEEGIRSLNSGLKLVVSNDEMLAQFYMYLGDTYHALQQDENAFISYEQSLKINGNNAYVLNNYAYYLTLRGRDLEKAERMAKKAVEIEPRNSSFQDTYGWIFYKQGKYSEALEWIGKSLEDKEGVSSEVLEHYGDVLFRLGDTGRAYEYWVKAKKKGGGSSFLEQKLAEKKLYE